MHTACRHTAYAMLLALVVNGLMQPSHFFLSSCIADRTTGHPTELDKAMFKVILFAEANYQCEIGSAYG